MTGEGTKAFVRECYHLSNQLVNLWCGMVVEFVTPSTFNDSRRSRFVQAKNIPPIEFVLLSFFKFRNSEVNELQSIQQLLNSEDSYPELFSEPSALEPPQTVPSMKKDYNTRSLPTKLIKKRCEQPKPKQPRRWWLYPLYLLYPILVHFFQYEFFSLFKIDCIPICGPSCYQIINHVRVNPFAPFPLQRFHLISM